MFSHIDLSNLADSPSFGHAARLAFFAGRARQDFRPGLNILFGPNASGKTTLLQMLARSLCAAETGVSALTVDAIASSLDITAALHGTTPARTKGALRQRPFADRIGVEVVHDGQPVVHCDPRRRLDKAGGTSGDDGFVAGLLERRIDRRRSHGQAALARADFALSILFGRTPFPTAIERTLDASSVNDVWAAALGQLDARLQGTIPRGQPTLLFDEPETALSLQWQCRLWNKLADAQVAATFQLIVATHSPFALGIGHANYIDFEPGFRQEVEALLHARFGAAAAASPVQSLQRQSRSTGRARRNRAAPV